MMLLRSAALAGATLAVPIFAQATQTAPPAVAAMSAAKTPADKNQVYSLHAQEGDTFEIAASRLALQRSRDRQIQAFAQTMIAHHTRSLQELGRLVRRGERSSEADLSEPKSQMLDKLRSSSAAEFDTNYVQGQIAAHEEALALHRAYASSGRDARLRAFAGRAVPLVAGHLERARVLQTKLR